MLAKRRRSKRTEVDQEGTEFLPLADVVFQLLAYFVITFTAGVAHLHLPPANESIDTVGQVFELDISLEGGAWVYRTVDGPVEPGLLAPAIQDGLRSVGREDLTINASRECPWPVLSACLDAAEEAGALSVQIMTSSVTVDP